tara:strand:- start:76 stop:270 length:195 start_codon:yes stop_codon:yes gene_type:complete
MEKSTQINVLNNIIYTKNDDIQIRCECLEMENERLLQENIRLIDTIKSLRKEILHYGVSKLDAS